MAIKVPVKEGTFIEDEQGGALIGNKCAACGQFFFPKVNFCFSCYGKDMKEIKLSRKAKLYAFTINRMDTAHFPAPHANGYVEMPEGIRVFAPLVMEEGKPLKVGMDMELYIGKLWQEGENEVIGWWFKPV